MKTRNNIIALVLMVFAASSCSQSFLEQPPYGSTLTQAQYEQMDNALETSMRGVYSMLYNKISTSHDEFGKRGIDLATDMLSGDIALTSYSYGWFYVDEQGQTATSRTSYVWTYYYKMLRNINKVIAVVGTQSDLTKRIAEYGLPTAYNEKKEAYYVIVGTDTVATYNLADADIAGYYAQALTMRGYIYSNLINLYAPTNAQMGTVWEEEVVCPIYNENNLEDAQPVASLKEVYQQVESDLTLAISYFDAFADTYMRTSKLVVDADVARGFLAYSYLNKALPNSTGYYSADNYNKAITYAKQVIDSKNYSVIRNEEVLTTGFNNVNDNSWMWGQDVTTETASGLASFFGQVDIHSYSYAWAGDTKVIDENLYKHMTDSLSFDIRIKWFNDGTKNSSFKLCPDGKFFSAKNPTSTADSDLDREWLSDNVYMRIESMYLIAAEASYRLGKYDEALSYLRGITDQRVDPAEGAAAKYEAYIAKLAANSKELLMAIEDNWRIELWGEGYGLQTFRRLSAETTVDGRKRGGNHASEAGAKMDATAAKFVFRIPSSETSYNPHYGTELP